HPHSPHVAQPPLNTISPSHDQSAIHVDGHSINADGIHYLWANATDIAGNVGFPAVTVFKIDSTPPLISGAPTTNPDNSPYCHTHDVLCWYHHDVTVHFTASDATSGVASVTPDIVLSDDGPGQQRTGTSIDHAGN